MGTIASTVQRFFHPAATDQMLETFVPLINGTNLNVCSNYTAECLRSQIHANVDRRVSYLLNSLS
jgi:hypothetical protein